MNPKKIVYEKMANIFAKAEIELDAPEARRYMEPYLANRIFDSLSAEELEVVALEIAGNYTGKEKVGSRVRAGVFKRFQEHIGMDYGVRVDEGDTLQEAADKLYQAERKATIEKIRKDIVAWNISKDELFPDRIHYGH